jgi:hypothetical protein
VSVAVQVPSKEAAWAGTGRLAPRSKATVVRARTASPIRKSDREFMVDLLVLSASSARCTEVVENILSGPA